MHAHRNFLRTDAFHSAYCRYLMQSPDGDSGVTMLIPLGVVLDLASDHPIPPPP
ncbi:MAG: hypothetical protein H0U28_12700 [Nocardioidaceae bacterium]|nr:hypothetical protein [Nocardioidaceae bacterium]